MRGGGAFVLVHKQREKEVLGSSMFYTKFVKKNFVSPQEVDEDRVKFQEL